MKSLKRVEPKVEAVLGARQLQAQNLAVMADRRGVVAAAHGHAGAGVERERHESLRLLRLGALAVDENGVDLGHGHDHAAVDASRSDDAAAVAFREASDAVRTRLGVVTRLAQTK